MTPVPRPTHKVRGELATIAFQGEALDSAAEFIHGLAGCTVTAVPYDEPTFDAVLLGVVTGEDGQYKAILAPWDDETDSGDTVHARPLDIYDELDRIEVF